MATLLLKNGRLLDPLTRLDETGDILIENGVIAAVGRVKNGAGATILDMGGKLVMPGIVDLHVHLRDMEQNAKETVDSGTRAAIAGGVTTVLAMGNTVPRLDSVETIRRYQAIIAKDAKNHVMTVGAITEGLRGQKIAPLESYPALGIRFISDDGFDIDDEALFREACTRAALLDLTVIIHPEVMGLAPDGVINEGAVSRRLGVPGQPNEKEWKAVERAIRFSAETGARVHLTHVSTRESVQLVREAKQNGLSVTCDTTPHHLILTDEAAADLGSLAKVNPPLRTPADREALAEGLEDGTVDFIVTDHAPHEEKDSDLSKAAFGFSEIEISLPLILTELHFGRGMNLLDALRLMTAAPADFAGLPCGRLKPGAPADLAVIDLTLKKPVDRHAFVSKGHNTPFHGKTLQGWPVMTVVDGKVIFSAHG